MHAKAFFRRLAQAMTLIGLSLGAAQAMAYAECDFDRNNNKLVRFTPIDSQARMRGRTDSGRADVYPDWYASIETGARLDQRTYFGRFAKLASSPAKTVTERDPVTKQKYLVRYYPADVGNCDRVYLRVSDNDPRLVDLLGSKEALARGQVPLATIGHIVGVRFEDNVQYFRSLIGETLSVAGPEGLPFIPEKGQEIAHIDPWTPVILRAVDDRAFMLNHQTEASFRLRVELEDGTTGLVPARLHRLHEPGALDGFSQSQQAHIRAGSVRPGMSQDAVYLAWGPAAEVKDFPVIKTRSGAIETLYGDSDGSVRSGEVIGIESHWYYPSHLGEHPLIFTQDGVLDDQVQHAKVMGRLSQ